MRLPFVWISIVLAGGMALAPSIASVAPPPVLYVISILFLVIGGIWLGRRRVRTAAACVLFAWAAIGALARSLEGRTRPANHVTSLLSKGALDIGVPLRWQGQLREDPERLPWGFRYDLDLVEVEEASTRTPITGGLRISYFYSEREVLPPEGLRAGDCVEALVRARPPRSFGNPGAVDFAAALARQGIHLTATLRSGELLRKVAGPPISLRHYFARARGALLARIDSLFAAQPWPGAILRAMLLGDRSFIDRERTVSFQKSATYHVLVIAGLHVAALVAFVLWCGRRLRFGLLSRTIATLAVLVMYVALVEDRPPILRAALMATAYLGSRLFYRRVELLNSIALAALVILLARPSSLSDASFQLSFLAVGTIAGLALPWIEQTTEPYRRGLDHLTDVTRDVGHPPLVVQMRLDLRALSAWLSKKLPRRTAPQAPRAVTFPLRAGIALWDMVVLSLTIQIGMLPLLALYFHRVSLSGPIANIPAVLLTGLVVPLGFLTLVVSFLARGAGLALAKLLGWLLSALAASVDWFARLNWASFRIPGPPLRVLVAYLLALCCLMVAVRAKRRLWQFLFGVPLLLLLIVVATFPFAPHLAPGRLEVTVLDVGQGDSLFLAFPDGHTMLIDGGGTLSYSRDSSVRAGLDTGEQVVSPYLWERGMKRLDVVALTHAHQDHIGGLAAVLDNFKVSELWLGRDVDSRSYRALIEEARARGTSVIHHTQGDIIRWQSVEDRVLWPPTSKGAEPPKNDDSLVLRLVFGDTAMMLPGDIERPVENSLVGASIPLDADFLKLGHHGSKTSTTPQWLSEVHPRIAAISVGENNTFGHPNADVVERLEAAGVHIYRTDRDGAITVVSDGKSLSARAFLFSGSR